jgi:hypothetical protein
VRQYLPGDHGSVLITTRLSRLAQLGSSKRLVKVDEELGKAIFRQWYGRELGNFYTVYEFGLKLINYSHGRHNQRDTRSARRSSTCAGVGCLVSPRDGTRYRVICSVI